MKICSQCRTSYPDDLVYCLTDGNALMDDPGESAGQSHSAGLASGPAAVSPKGVNPIFAYLTVGLFALIIGGAVVGFILMRNSGPNDSAAPPPAASPTSSPVKANVAENGNTSVLQSEPDLPPMTAKAAELLIKAWEAAQDRRNFRDYRACFDPSFQGVKRTVEGKVIRYDYASWMSDRQKTMSRANYLDIGIDKLQISVQGDVATLEFDQYYRTTGYADFGPKVVRMKMTADGPKIVYEELKSAALLTD